MDEAGTTTRDTPPYSDVFHVNLWSRQLYKQHLTEVRALYDYEQNNSYMVTWRNEIAASWHGRHEQSQTVSTDSENPPVCLLLAFRWQCVRGVSRIRAIQMYIYFTYLLTFLHTEWQNMRRSKTL